MFHARVVENFLGSADGEHFFIEQNDLIGVFGYEIEIMRDQNDRHIFLGAQLEHDLIEELETVLIDAGDGLIEQEQVGQGLEGESEENALQFAAAQCTETTIDQVFGFYAREIVEHLSAKVMRRKQPDRSAREASHEKIHDRCGRADVETQILRHVADDGVTGMFAFGIDVMKCAGVIDFAEDCLQQCRLTGTVRSDQCRQLSAMDVKIDVVEDDQLPRADAEMFNASATDFGAIVGRRGDLKIAIHSFRRDYITTLGIF